ncbi:MAG: HesB/IscA family protein [Terracidiphilus sp.]
MNVSMTPAADKFIRRMLRFGGGPESGFRLSVAPGGCSGLTAEFDVEAAPRPGDAIVTLNGLRLFLPAESRLLLDGVTIDFTDSLMSSGFVFHDPKSNGSSCSTASPSPFVTLGSLAGSGSSRPN